MHQFIRLVSILSVALLSVSAGPADQSLFRMVMAPFTGDARALSPAGTTCANNYNNATSKNVDQLTNATNACEEAANRTTVANNLSSNSSVTTVRSQLLQLEQNLQLCKNLTDSALYLNCTVAYFEKNLQLLDNSNTLAYQSISQFSSNATSVEAERANCISAAVSQAKVQNIQSANDYDTCMSKIPAQREFMAYHPQESQEHQEHEHEPEHKHEHEEDSEEVHGDVDDEEN
ncbi:uncharacterized protein [Drosophila tropicalis]|uniref:uncharacterized protein n=1 Tax=Drosophila tropicalis TaxID=46794 RepID=UPI0035ABEB3C